MAEALPAPAHKPLYKRLYLQVLTAILVGALLGYLAPGVGVALRPLGEAFIKLIKMMIAPIVFATVTVGIAKMGHMSQVGKVGLKALVYFEVVSSIALLIGLVVVNILAPGAGVNADVASLDTKEVDAFTTSAKSLGTVDFLLNIIPSSVVDGFAKGEILQVLLFSVLFGLGLLSLRDKAEPLVALIEDLYHELFSVIGMIMSLAPGDAFG